jgi:hypothetical protein
MPSRLTTRSDLASAVGRHPLVGDPPEQQRVDLLELPQAELVELVVHHRPVELPVGTLVVAVDGHHQERQDLPHRTSGSAVGGEQLDPGVVPRGGRQEPFVRGATGGRSATRTSSGRRYADRGHTGEPAS